MVAAMLQTSPRSRRPGINSSTNGFSRRYTGGLNTSLQTMQVGMLQFAGNFLELLTQLLVQWGPNSLLSICSTWWNLECVQLTRFTFVSPCALVPNLVESTSYCFPKRYQLVARWRGPICSSTFSNQSSLQPHKNEFLLSRDYTRAWSQVESHRAGSVC